jgi:hypothetical protein
MRWDDLDITKFLAQQPKDINIGRRYVIFYGPTCEHCYELLTIHFRGALPAPTTVIAIPQFKDRWETEGVFQMRCTECEQLELRLGCDYLIEPPLVIALENGVVQCAVETDDADDPKCLIWH